DTGGKYLYLAASTDAGPALTWFSQASADVAQTNALYLVCLAKDTPSPLAKESDEEKLAAPAKPSDDKKPEDKKDDDKKVEEKKAVEVAIDFEGLAQRIVALPIAKASFTGLRCGESGQLFYLKSE